MSKRTKKGSTSQPSAQATVPVVEPQADVFVPEYVGHLQPWHRIARGYLGLKEIPGADDNPVIIKMHDTTTLSADDDETPWCSSAMNLWMKEAGRPYTRSAAAKSWLAWGVSIDTPRVGCVVIFKRKGGHHVALFEGMHKGRIMALGGNQSNTVSIDDFDPSDVLGYRWPAQASNLKPSI